MRKILMSSLLIAVIGIGLTATQLSCTKTTAQTTSYVLPPATTSTLGGVMVDGTTIKIDASGKISTVSNNSSQLNKVLYAIGYGAC